MYLLFEFRPGSSSRPGPCYPTSVKESIRSSCCSCLVSAKEVSAAITPTIGVPNLCQRFLHREMWFSLGGGIAIFAAMRHHAPMAPQRNLAGGLNYGQNVLAKATRESILWIGKGCRFCSRKTPQRNNRRHVEEKCSLVLFSSVPYRMRGVKPFPGISRIPNAALENQTSPISEAGGSGKPQERN